MVALTLLTIGGGGGAAAPASSAGGCGGCCCSSLSISDTVDLLEAIPCRVLHGTGAVWNVATGAAVIPTIKTSVTTPRHLPSPAGSDTSTDTVTLTAHCL